MRTLSDGEREHLEEVRQTELAEAVGVDRLWFGEALDPEDRASRPLVRAFYILAPSCVEAERILRAGNPGWAVWVEDEPELDTDAGRLISAGAFRRSRGQCRHLTKP